MCKVNEDGSYTAEPTVLNDAVAATNYASYVSSEMSDEVGLPSVHNCTHFTVHREFKSPTLSWWWCGSGLDPYTGYTEYKAAGQVVADTLSNKVCILGLQRPNGFNLLALDTGNDPLPTYSQMYARLKRPVADWLLTLYESDQLGSLTRTLYRDNSLFKLRDLFIEVSRKTNNRLSFGSLLKSLITCDFISYRSQVLRVLSKKRPELKSRLKRAAKATGRGAKQLSSDYLAYIFGISPLISDTRNTIRFLNRHHAKKNKAAMPSIVKARWSDVPKCILHPSDPPSGQGVGWQTRNDYRLVSVERHVVMTAVETTTYDSKAMQTVDRLLKRFTAGGLASEVWELVPFSFVVDWFLDLNGLITKLDELVSKPSLKVLGCTRSETAEVTVARWLTFRFPGRNGAIIPKFESAPWDFISYRWYSRSKMVPDGQLVTWAPNVGKSRLITLSALAIQRLKGL